MRDGWPGDAGSALIIPGLCGDLLLGVAAVGSEDGGHGLGAGDGGEGGGGLGPRAVQGDFYAKSFARWL